MSLKARIQEDMKAALKARETRRLSATRLLLAAIQQREVDERRELADEEVIGVVDKMMRQRRESIAQYEAANRPDLSAAETYELNLLSGYLPNRLTEGEVAAEVSAAIAGTGAASLGDMGKVMAALRQRLAGRADMGAVSALVKSRLAGSRKA